MGDLTNVQSAVLLDREKMGRIVISFKIFPKGLEVDLEELKKEIEKSLPKLTSIYGYQTEPVAFGLNALIAHIIIPENESGLLDKVEEELARIPEVSQIQTIMVRRTQ
ncbi:MAG TPA: elongation factor 1-beta [Candidatus Krumholzibacteriaceae bacterium]|nr:elongation factor 1-beta [Candidatus Krumholzibacteriaceae bacterium]